jgi:hypothetical protein
LDILSDKGCDEDFADEFFIFPSVDCGNIGLILGAKDWENIETKNSKSKLDYG